MKLKYNLITFLSILCLFLLTGSFSQAVSIPETPGKHVVDLAGIIDNSTEAKLNQYLKELEQKTTAQLAILTINSLEGESIEDFSITIAHSRWKLGQKEKITVCCWWCLSRTENIELKSVTASKA